MYLQAFYTLFHVYHSAIEINNPCIVTSVDELSLPNSKETNVVRLEFALE